MVTFTVDILEYGVRLSERWVGVALYIKGYVREVDGVFICFDRNAKSVVVEDAANLLLKVFCLSR